jgi:hypothetical protein
MIFDKYFDKVVIINLPDKNERLDRCVKELKEKGLCESPTVFRAIHGDSVGVSDWFKWGGGAWGCFLSHSRIIEDFCMDFNFRKEDKSSFPERKILILEDDVIFCDNTKEKFEKFVKEIPNDWGQFYLGGQHTMSPQLVSSSIYNCRSVNRTHAYAVRGSIAKQFHKHITYSPDYRGANHHIDHQIEVAHRRGDWKTYAPFRWIAGQGENKSDINGRQHPNKWWDWEVEEIKLNIPFIIIDCDPEPFKKFLHYGYNLDDDGQTVKGLSSSGYGSDFIKNINNLFKQAWDQRSLPSAKNMTDMQIQKLSLTRRSGTLKLSEVKNDLKNIINKCYGL